MHDERAAFEANIDANPLDATNHLVYADWLDEHNEPDEAAFRRTIGEWMKKFTPRKRAQITTSYGGDIKDWVVGKKLGYPKGAEINEDEAFGDFKNGRGNDPRNNPKYHKPAGFNYSSGAHYSFRWGNYRDMERALRTAFTENRRRQPEQLTRRRLARKRYS